MIDSLTQLLKSYSLHEPANSASSTASSAAAASCTADSSSQSHAQQSPSSELADPKQQSAQAGLLTRLAQGGDLSGEDQNALGLIQHSRIEMQPVILATLLPCLTRHHVFSEAVFADCRNWYTQVAENIFSLTEDEDIHPLPAMPFITPYLHMMRRSSFSLSDSTQTRFEMLFTGSTFSSCRVEAMPFAQCCT